MKNFLITLFVVGMFVAFCGVMELFTVDFSTAFSSAKDFFISFRLIMIGLGAAFLAVLPIIFKLLGVLHALIFGMEIPKDEK